MPEDQIETVEKAEESTGPDFSKVAEALNKQYNPLEETQSQEFVSEPFFKEEVTEGENKEVVDEVKTPELNADGTVKEVVRDEVVTTPIIEATKTEEKSVDVVALLNTALGDINFGSVEEIKSIVAEHKKFKEAENQYRELSQEERARIELGRESGDFGLYDRVMSIDTAKITAKEALKQVFFLDNLDSTPQYLDKKFEKDFIKTYEEETDEEYSKLELENNGRKAIERIIELQQDLKTRGQISGGADPDEALKAKEEADTKWFAAVDNVINKTDRISYELEDDVTKEKFVINIVMDAKDKTLIQEAMDQPIDYLKSRITDDKGNFDHDALMEFILRDVYYEKALEEARKSGAAHREEKILKEKKQSVIESGKAGDPGIETPLKEQIAKNFSRLINH